jgi:hypothetical protein
MYSKFLEYKNYNEVLDSKFIKKFNDNYIEENNLGNYYEKTTIDFLKPVIACYIKEKKEIIINTDKFIKTLLHTNDYDPFNLNPKITYEINKIMISTLYHELTHVYQIKEFSEGNNKLLIDIYNDSYNLIRNNNNLYKKIHKYVPIEWNANFKSQILLDEFLKQDNINENIKTWFDLGYIESDGHIINPLEQYLYYSNKDYYEYYIKNNKYYNEFSEKEKILYGLPISFETYQIEKNIDKEKVKKYIKEWSNNGR